MFNEFDSTADYADLFDSHLESGFQVDAFGVKTHMRRGYRGKYAITSILDRFGLPVHMIETALESVEIMPPDIVDLYDYQVESWPATPAGGEHRAAEMARRCRNVFPHPATESLTNWGLADEGSWLGAPSGMVRLHGAPKPAFVDLEKLLKGEWWMGPTTAVTDDAGRVGIEGVAGWYDVTVAGVTVSVDASRSGVHEFSLTVSGS